MTSVKFCFMLCRLYSILDLVRWSPVPVRQVSLVRLTRLEIEVILVPRQRPIPHNKFLLCRPWPPSFACVPDMTPDVYISI
jgi:hypothetical protein